MNFRDVAHLTGKITVPPSAKITRMIQKHPWQSKKWQQAYGTRNIVENSNKPLKDVAGADLGTPKRRTGRGITFQSFIAAFAVAAENIGRIVSGITKVLTGKVPASLRGRKRYGVRGERLTHTETPQTQVQEQAQTPTTQEAGSAPPIEE